MFKISAAICLMVLPALMMCSCSLSSLTLEQTPFLNRVFSKDSAAPKNSGTAGQSKQPAAVPAGELCSHLASLKIEENPTASQIISDVSDLNRDSTLSVNGLKPVRSHSAEIIAVFAVTRRDGTAAQLVSADKDGEILLWQRVKGAWRAFELVKFSPPPGAVAFNPRAGLIASARPGRVEIMRAGAQQPPLVLERLTTRLTSLEFSPCGDSLVLAGADGMVYRWKFLNEAAAEKLADKERALERYFGHGSVVSKVSYHPFGRLFFSSDWQGVLSAWRPYDTDSFEGVYDENAVEGRLFTEESERASAGRSSTDIVEDIKIDRSGKYVFLATEKGSLEVWQVRGFKLLGETVAHSGTVFSLALSPQGARAATVGRDGLLRVWKFTVKPSEKITGSLEATLEKIKEIKLDHAGILYFLDEDTLIAGTTKGQLLEIDLKI